MSESLPQFTEPRLFEEPSVFEVAEFGGPLATHVNTEALQPLIAAKAIRIRQHPTEPLDIVNYQPKYSVPQGLAEDPIINECRGLIFNRETREIVARPFPRMHELGPSEELPEGDQIVFEKLDGSLGVQYMDSNGNWCMASRGNFTHRHAEFGTQMIQELQQQLERENHHFRFNPNYTYLWEMIFPEGKHTVDYGDQRRIALLGVVETATGQEFVEAPDGTREFLLPDQSEVPFHVVRQFTGEHFYSAHAMRELDFPNAEGFVVLMTSGPQAGRRFKVKFPAYDLRNKEQKGELEQHLYDRRKVGETPGAIMELTPPSMKGVVYRYLRDLDEKLVAAGGEQLANMIAASRNEEMDEGLRIAYTTGVNAVFRQILQRGGVERPVTPAQEYQLRRRREAEERRRLAQQQQQPEQNP